MSFLEDQLKRANAEGEIGPVHDYLSEAGQRFDQPNDPRAVAFHQPSFGPGEPMNYMQHGNFPPDPHVQSMWHQGFPMMNQQMPQASPGGQPGMPIQTLERTFMNMQVPLGDQGNFVQQHPIQYPGFGFPQINTFGQPFYPPNIQYGHPNAWGLGASMQQLGTIQPEVDSQNVPVRLSPEQQQQQQQIFEQQQAQQMKQMQQMLQQQSVEPNAAVDAATAEASTSGGYNSKPDITSSKEKSDRPKRGAKKERKQQGQEQPDSLVEQAPKVRDGLSSDVASGTYKPDSKSRSEGSGSASKVFDRSEKRSLPARGNGGFSRSNEFERGKSSRGYGRHNQAPNQQHWMIRPSNAAEQQYNNLMGDWDKVRVMRIQLQQLVSQDPYNEDFYYQVYSTIRERREDQTQPLDLFSKTYLFQRGGRRYFRYFQNCGDHSDDTLSRLQQQVQAVVEKVRGRPQKDRLTPPPKSFGRKSGTTPAHPRKLLPLSLDVSDKDEPSRSELTRESVLALCESAFEAVLAIESHMWAKPHPESPEAAEWAEQMPALEKTLWDCLEVRSAPDSKGQQPFMCMLALDKGKKLIPRAFSYLNNTARLTVLTRIFHQIDDLDVIRNGNYRDSKLSTRDNNSVQLFVQTALQPLVQYIGELELETINLLIDMILSSSKDIVQVLRTEVGQAFFTVLISRSELINQEGTAPEQDVASWKETFGEFFVTALPHLSSLFPPEDVNYDYVWNFLAALALGANLEQQRSIVDSVRERIFTSMSEARALPKAEGEAKIANLNLLLNVMGLNATFDEVTALDA